MPNFKPSPNHLKILHYWKLFGDGFVAGQWQNCRSRAIRSHATFLLYPILAFIPKHLPGSSSRFQDIQWTQHPDHTLERRHPQSNKVDGHAQQLHQQLEYHARGILRLSTVNWVVLLRVEASFECQNVKTEHAGSKTRHDYSRHVQLLQCCIFGRGSLEICESSGRVLHCRSGCQHCDFCGHRSNCCIASANWEVNFRRIQQ